MRGKSGKRTDQCGAMQQVMLAATYGTNVGGLTSLRRSRRKTCAREEQEEIVGAEAGQ